MADFVGLQAAGSVDDCAASRPGIPATNGDMSWDLSLWVRQEGPQVRRGYVAHRRPRTAGQDGRSLARVLRDPSPEEVDAGVQAAELSTLEPPLDLADRHSGVEQLAPGHYAVLARSDRPSVLGCPKPLGP